MAHDRSSSLALKSDVRSSSTSIVTRRGGGGAAAATSGRRAATRETLVYDDLICDGFFPFFFFS